METGRLSGPQRAKLVAFPTPNAGPVAAYETIVTHLLEDAPLAVQSVVDARTGKILMRANLVDHAVDNPRWKVFPRNPKVGLNHYPWNYSERRHPPDLVLDSSPQLRRGADRGLAASDGPVGHRSGRLDEPSGGHDVHDRREATRTRGSRGTPSSSRTRRSGQCFRGQRSTRR